VAAYDFDTATYLPFQIASSKCYWAPSTGGGNTMIYDGTNLLIGYATSNGAYKLQVNSQIWATNATITTSDSKVKENVVPLQDGMATINKITPVTFKFIEHDVHNFDKTVQIGFIADQVKIALDGEIYADSVVHQTDDLMGLSEAKLVPILVKAIQELCARITALEAK
jgi:hypothetical protein